ncbi:MULTISPECIES: hypothetical protein [Acinetobacter]|uniref:hypothetical protein n=1 Tax=Acinetobacter TaxID=469 RepID=UPI00141BA494|nr:MULTISPECIES: hypothetical protein [Acinetobacter]MCS4300148.1 hypothetical protein [Acinetobacter guillouiae]MCW2251302.1 hypothetical protein [Acinetobacter sp. BIGb0204]NII36200.1 hypothetical protein [Acinetobacter sp. BIGb0196]
MYLFFKISILSLPIIFTGCISTAKNTTIIEYYSPPQASSRTATIIGDLYDRKYVANTVAFIFAVNKKKVVDGYHKLKEPLILQAGEHDLQIWCGRGAFNYTNLVKVHIQPNKRYQVGYELNPNKQEGCVFWVEDLETQKPVTELVNGVGLWRANPITYRPIQKFLEPRPNTSQGYTVPITIINKMGTR